VALGTGGRYELIGADERGWLWSNQLGLWLGKWKGSYQEVTGAYPRFYDKEGNLILIGREDQTQRADALAAELAHVRARLGEPPTEQPPP
jgi:hypothetical protein